MPYGRYEIAEGMCKIAAMDNPGEMNSGVDLREHAVYLLTEAAPMAGMKHEEARLVVDAMRPLQVVADTLLEMSLSHTPLVAWFLAQMVCENRRNVESGAKLGL